MRRSPQLLLLTTLALLPACPPVDNDYLPFPEPSYEVFVGRIQPIIAPDCSNLGCHGATDRALTLYAVDVLRAVSSIPGAPLDPDELSEGELRWNYDALRGRLVDEESADDSYLLLKCLDPEVGGIEHAKGTVVYETRDDPRYQTLADWIEEGL